MRESTAEAGKRQGRTRSRWLVAGLIVGLGGALALFQAFRVTLRADLERVSGRATVLPSPFGPMEYLEGGQGPPVLLVHGAGGGFDMGELMAEVLLGEGFRWISPSRFGYLGSGVPDGAGPEAQARAFAWLLDELGLDQVAVVALSAGGPSALHFVLLYPERASSLTLVSAGLTRVTDEAQGAADWKGRALVRLYTRDFPYWAFTKAFEGRFIGLLGADARVAEELTAEQREWVRRLVDSMRPVSLRSAGVGVDHHQPLPGELIAAVRAPTLIVHAQDDGLQLFENARFAAATIPGARLLRFERGGHLVVITEAATIQREVREHILEHAGEADHHMASASHLTPETEIFHSDMVTDLPEPARRFLLQAIAPGTPLAHTVELEMHGEIRLAPERDPVPFVAEQVLEPPVRFVWRARTTAGLVRIRGFDRYEDEEGEMRWKLWGLIPVVRGTGADVTRSAAGRLAMEAILVPASLLPGHGAEWEPVDGERARFRMRIGEETVETTLEVDAEGRPVRATAMRWSERAGPGYEPFAVEFGGALHSQGYTIPARIEAGWSLGGDDEFRFFAATLDRARFQ